MKMKHRYSILANSMLSSWLLGFLVLLFQSLASQDVHPIIWLILIAVILIWIHKFELDKSVDDTKLTWAEQFFLIANLITVIFAFGGFLVILSQYWLAKELKYFSLALGLPSLIAVIYWFILKRGMFAK